jgi:hypothetical protein
MGVAKISPFSIVSSPPGTPLDSPGLIDKELNTEFLIRYLRVRVHPLQHQPDVSETPHVGLDIEVVCLDAAGAAVGILASAGGCQDSSMRATADLDGEAEEGCASGGSWRLETGRTGNGVEFEKSSGNEWNGDSVVVLDKARDWKLGSQTASSFSWQQSQPDRVHRFGEDIELAELIWLEGAADDGVFPRLD